MYKSSASSMVLCSKSMGEIVQNIKDITVNHNEEDIYAMLKECSMDPNEAIDRLLHLGPYYEVKSKRTKRNEKMNSRALEESGQKPGYQGHGWGSGKGSYSSLNRSHGIVHGRSTVVRKENGVVANRERVFKPSPKPVATEAGAKVLPHAGRSTSVCVDGSEMVPKSSPSAAKCAQQSAAGYTNSAKDVTDAGATKSTSSSHTKTNMDQESLPVDPVLVQPRGSKRVIMVGTIQCEIGCLRAAALGPRIDLEQNPATTKLPEARSGSETAIALVKETANSTLKQEKSEEKLEFPDGQQVIRPDQIQVPEAVKSILHFGTIETSYLSHPKSNKNSSHTAYSLHVENTVVPRTSSRNARLHQLRIGTIDASCMNNSESNKTSNHTGDLFDVKTIEKPISSNQLLQLRYGIFDPSYFNNSESKKIKNYSANLLDNETVEVPKPSTSNKKSPATAKEGSLDQAQDLSHVHEQVLLTESKASYNDQLKNAKLPTVSPSSSVVHPTPLSVSASGNQDAPSTIEEANHPDNPPAPSHVQEQVLPIESEISNKDQLRNEKLPIVTASLYSVVQPTPTLRSSLLQHERLQPQVWISSPNSSSSPSSSPNSIFMHGNAPAASTSAPTSPSTQSAMAQCSIDVPVLIFWEPYPLLNYTPCSHYYSPLEVQSTLDPFFGYSGLPQLQSTGNSLVTPPSTTMGMQLPLALHTMEINTRNQAHGGPSFWIPTNYSNWPRNTSISLQVDSHFNRPPQGHCISTAH